ncbi:DUF805 domain-containing protein [Brevundimonas sp. 2R-24]|uniref:DUF805 domain-containing protein n=1 Tax=Peiella sedimenti TaxID=3061083 RepID=A0ABT8SPJ5_9CAUL|nr:DUF805 domain-containing protein [Caulobacteraceae bacterium XZ-24]
MPRDWGELFFSSTGRMGRRAFLVGAATLIVALALYQGLFSGWPRLLTAWLVYTALFVSAVCVLAKRLHDVGRSGWWSAPLLLLFIWAWPWPDGWLDHLAALIVVVAALSLASLPGEKAFNRYGPPATV